MKVSEMKVGERGYVFPWRVRPFSYYKSDAALYIDKNDIATSRKKGTSELLIIRGPYGIKIDRRIYLERGAPFGFDIQLVSRLAVPEIPQDVEWVVGWIGEDSIKTASDKLIKVVERCIERSVDIDRGLSSGQVNREALHRKVSEMIGDLAMLLRKL